MHHHNTVPDSPQEIRAFLEYMLNHNISHADEVSKTAEKLKENGECGHNACKNRKFTKV